MPKILCILLLSLLFLNSTARADGLRFGVTAPGRAELAEALLTEAYRRINLPISTHYLPSPRSLRESNSGSLDGELFRTDLSGKGYENLVQIPVALLSIEIVVVTNQNIDTGETENFQDMQFAVVSGLVFVESLIERYRLQELVRVNNFEQQMGLFLSKKVDAIFATPSMAEAIIKTHSGNHFHVVPIHTSVSLYHYLHKKHSDLVPLITQSLNDMKSSGAFDRIVKLHYEQREADLASKIEK